MTLPIGKITVTKILSRRLYLVLCHTYVIANRSGWGISYWQYQPIVSLDCLAGVMYLD